jgi:serine/threonine-protein kinase
MVDEEQPEATRAIVDACLDENRVWLEALTEIWSSAEPLDVHGVTPAAASLPTLRTCVDPSFVQSKLDQAAEAGPDMRLHEGRARLLRARASHLAGRRLEALTDGRDLATSTGHDALRAEAWLLVGQVLGQETRFAESEEAFKQAMTFALRNGRSDLVGEAAAKLVVVVAYRGQRFEEAGYWGDVAEAAFAGAGVAARDTRQASLAANLGTFAAVRGDYAVALKLHRKAQSLWESTVGEDHPSTVTSAENVASDLGFLDRRREAITIYEHVLALRERSLGPEHPSVAGTLDNYGNSLRSQERYDEAIVAHERALEINTAAYGPEHPRVADSLENLASDLMEAEDHARAYEIFTRALEIEARASGEDSVTYARLLANRAPSLAGLGRFDEAIDGCERSLAIRERTFGADHPDVAWAYFVLGYVAYEASRFTLSRDAYTRAVAIREAKLPPTSVRLAESRTELGLALIETKKPTAALEVLALAKSALVDGDAPRSKLARNEHARAKALAALGRSDEARRSAEAAAATYREVDAEETAQEVDAWIAAELGESR